MSRRGLVAAGLGAAGALAGCANRSVNLTVEQRSALETFEVDAPRDEAFRAAAGVMLDQGMIVAMSDFGAGLVSGGSWGYGAGVGHAHAQAGDGLLVWVRSAGPGKSVVRVRMVPGGDPEDPRAKQFIQQVQERTMIAAAPRRAGP